MKQLMHGCRTDVRLSCLLELNYGRPVFGNVLFQVWRVSSLRRHNVPASLRKTGWRGGTGGMRSTLFLLIKVKNLQTEKEEIVVPER